MADHQLNIAQARAIAVECVAASTLRTYERHWDHWTNYCQQHGLDLWTLTPEDFLGFLQSVYLRCASLSNVYQHLSSIAYFYRLKGLDSPSEAKLVTMYMKALKRRHVLRPSGTKRAQPLLRPEVDSLGELLLDPAQTLRVWRTVWRVHIMFYCMLRWSDLAPLEVKSKLSIPFSPFIHYSIFFRFRISN